MVQLYWLGIHAGIFLRHAITMITLETKIFIFMMHLFLAVCLLYSQNMFFY